MKVAEGRQLIHVGLSRCLRTNACASASKTGVNQLPFHQWDYTELEIRQIEVDCQDRKQETDEMANGRVG